MIKSTRLGFLGRNMEVLKTHERKYVAENPHSELLALSWAMGEGPPDKLHHMISSSPTALHWIEGVGTHTEKMKSMLKDREAVKYANRHGEHEEMVKKLNKDFSRYEWAKEVGTHLEKVMKEFDGDEKYAFKWAANVGNIPDMKRHIDSPYWKRTWNGHFSEEFEDQPAVREAILFEEEFIDEETVFQ